MAVALMLSWDSCHSPWPTLAHILPNIFQDAGLTLSPSSGVFPLLLGQKTQLLPQPLSLGNPAAVGLSSLSWSPGSGPHPFPFLRLPPTPGPVLLLLSSPGRPFLAKSIPTLHPFSAQLSLSGWNVPNMTTRVS